MDRPSRLRRFPVAFFAVIMGLAGLALAWKKAEVLFHPPVSASCFIARLAAIVFALLGVVYLAKLIRYPASVRQEFAHPMALNFFPTISIGLLLLAVAFADVDPQAAGLMWALGAAAQLVLTLHVMNAWIHHTHYEIVHVNPAWFIPVVGNIVVPIAGARFASAEISWFFFSVGIVFWLVLFTLVMYRLFFHAPLSARLMPTLFILIAPPAVGFVAYFQLTGHVDAFARVLYYTALMLTLLLATNGLRFLRARFFLSSWAYSFPLAAVTFASLVMAEQLRDDAFLWIGGALLAVLTLVVAALFLRTLVAMARREICIEEG